MCVELFRYETLQTLYSLMFSIARRRQVTNARTVEKSAEKHALEKLSLVGYGNSNMIGRVSMLALVAR